MSGSSGGSSDSWSLSKPMEFNVPGKFGQLEAGIRNIAASLSTRTPSKTEKEVLDKNLANLVETIDQVRDGLQESHLQVVDEFESVLSKLNLLSIAQYGLDSKIGFRHDFGKEEGLDTVFDGLRYLEALLSRKEKDVEDVRVRMESLEKDKIGFQTLLDNSRDELAEIRALKVKERMDDIESSLTKSMESLRNTFIGPFTRLRSQWKGIGTTEGAVLVRLAALETSLKAASLGSGGSFSTRTAPAASAAATGGISQADLNVIVKRMEALEVKNLEQIEALKNENANLKASLIQGLARVTSLEDSDGPGIYVGGTLWTGSTQCEHFLQHEMNWEDGSPFMAQDFVSMLHSLNADDSAQDSNSVLSRDHHASKGGFTNMGAVRVYSSMQQAHPAPFAGTGSSPLPGLKSYTDWDRQDNRNGKRNKLETQMISLARASMSLINSLITSATAKALFVHLINSSLEHWRQLAMFLSACYTESKALGSDAKEAWTFACEVVRGVFMELHAVRNVGAELSNIKSLTVQDAGRMLWGILQSHSLMDEIISLRFKGHPKLASYSIDHLFSNRLTPVALEAVNEKIIKLEANQKTMSSQIGKMTPPKKGG
eukprot:scaffold25597_cov206-Cylindrotheca_fusiformis.AAC.2